MNDSNFDYKGSAEVCDAIRAMLKGFASIRGINSTDAYNLALMGAEIQRKHNQDPGLKEAASDDVKAVLQMALGVLDEVVARHVYSGETDVELRRLCEVWQGSPSRGFDGEIIAWSPMPTLSVPNGTENQPALETLLISQSQADFMRAVDELLVTLDSGTMAEGWCALNARQWPKWELEIPTGRSQWAREYLLSELTRTVDKKLRLAAWQRWANHPNPVPSPSSIVEQEKWEVRHIPGTHSVEECWELPIGGQCVAIFPDPTEPRVILNLHNASIERAVKQVGQ